MKLCLGCGLLLAVELSMLAVLEYVRNRKSRAAVARYRHMASVQNDVREMLAARPTNAGARVPSTDFRKSEGPAPCAADRGGVHPRNLRRVSTGVRMECILRVADSSSDAATLSCTVALAAFAAAAWIANRLVGQIWAVKGFAMVGVLYLGMAACEVLKTTACLKVTARHRPQRPWSRLRRLCRAGADCLLHRERVNSGNGRWSPTRYCGRPERSVN